MTQKVITLAAVPRFDDEADVVILGYGIAGACAALEARRCGGDVLVIERASSGGGASALSSGLFYLGGCS
jgi:glycine/D-amino acid oxidase-like deaminating enzyme